MTSPAPPERGPRRVAEARAAASAPRAEDSADVAVVEALPVRALLTAETGDHGRADCAVDGRRSTSQSRALPGEDPPSVSLCVDVGDPMRDPEARALPLLDKSQLHGLPPSTWSWLFWRPNSLGGRELTLCMLPGQWPKICRMPSLPAMRPECMVRRPWDGGGEELAARETDPPWLRLEAVLPARPSSCMHDLKSFADNEPPISTGLLL
eukprot:CAMPEP_0203936424 /NCGR_PEP_ID=MMETSP0359-20131031/73979_1 /ASSEMBLY_ACC=CAM_ASM_000338 /TAXON_ID=268821 /ORGANISM="Scrippsiella Hangoei, Strain SHTV-5" /LENGTH=208 /DNA_ID=CAMNT_0050866413 /DNA_START=838 /DNA_END=1459 /DNA_ORIENTATION=+